MPNNQDRQQDEDRKEPQDDRAAGAGQGKDTETRDEDAPTAGGREGQFSQEDERENKGADSEWSPGSDQPLT